jgi:hypothetical protein
VPAIGETHVAVVKAPLFAGVVMPTVGAVRSTVRRPPVANMAARVLPAASVIAGVALERSRRIVPSPLPVLTTTVRVLVVPEIVPIEAPAIDPVVPTLRLPAATPMTFSLNVMVKFVDAPLVEAVAGLIELTVGADRSIVTFAIVATTFEFPAVSVTLLAARRRPRVPLLQFETVTG